MSLWYSLNKGAVSLRSATSWCARHTRASADCKHYKYWCCKCPVQFLLAMPIRVAGRMDSLLRHSVVARNKSSNVRACKAMHNILSLSLAASAAAFVHRPVGERCENLTCLAHKVEFVHICTSHWNTFEMICPRVAFTHPKPNVVWILSFILWFLTLVTKVKD